MGESTERSPALPPRQRTARDSRLYHGFVTPQGRGLVAIPVELRKRYGLDQPGVQYEISEREDGVLELRPMQAIPASEAWYWTPEFQAGEREVDRQIANSEGETFDGPDDFMGWLTEQDKIATKTEKLRR